MPSRKQRRRREKLKRHEWEEVYVDEEGRELPAEEAAELKSKPAREVRAKGEPSSRTGRHVDPPSWRRTFKRGLLFFPLMLITIFLIAGDEITVAQKLVQTLVLMAFFLPFSYFMDSVVWRSYQRRIAKSGETKKR
jgi:hypothetical protein